MKWRPGRSCPSLSGPGEGLQQKRLQTQQPCGVIAPSLSLSCQHDSSVLCMERGSTSMWGPVGAALRCPSVNLYDSIFVAQATVSCHRDYGRTTSLASLCLVMLQTILIALRPHRGNQLSALLLISTWPQTQYSTWEPSVFSSKNGTNRFHRCISSTYSHTHMHIHM